MIKNYLFLLIFLTFSSANLYAKGIETWYVNPAAYKKATGKNIGTFKESPMMSQQVTQGSIPSLDRRLPEEPLVLDPAYEIGKYGGSIQFIIDARHYMFEMPVTFSSNMYQDGVTEDDIIHPNVFTSWKVSDDAKEWTFTLRKGIKWSDGVDFTVKDFEFFHKYMLTHREITAKGCAGGKMSDPNWGNAKLTIINDHTLKYSFSVPNSTFLSDLAFYRSNPGYVASHYMKDFHKETADPAVLKKKLNDSGLSTWQELFLQHCFPWKIAGAPVIYAWVAVDDAGGAVQSFTRNPYYWKVDPDGNQLPYADGIDYRMYTGTASDEGGQVDVKLLKVMAGEVDFAHNWNVGNLDSLPVLLQKESNGLFDIRTPNYQNPENVGGFANAEACVRFKYDYKGLDPVKEALMKDVRFRRAISLSINRKEMNELVYNNMYQPSPSTMKWGGAHPGNEPRFSTYGAYDVEWANSLLDGIGLKWNGDRTARLLSDGRELRLIANLQSYASIDKIFTLFRDYFAAIGVKLFREKSVSTQWKEDKNVDIRIGNIYIGGDTPNLLGKTGSFSQGGDRAQSFGFGWTTWMDTGGAKGNEPPEPVKRVRQLSIEYKKATTAKKRWEIEEEILQIYVDNVYFVGGLVEPARYSVYSTRIGNIPDYKGLMIYIDAPATWYIK